MFTLQAAMPAILQACSLYVNGNMDPVIQFEYIDQDGNVTELTDMNITVTNTAPAILKRELANVIASTIERFNVDINSRYMMVCKVDTFQPKMKVTLKTALITVAMDAIRLWDELYA